MIHLLSVLPVLVAATNVSTSQPATAPSITNQLDVDSFGAIPDDGKDDTQALRKAIESCRHKPGTRLRLRKGRYDLSALPGKQQPLLPASGLTDILIDGQGAELMVHGWVGVLAFGDSRRVRIQDLSIDCVRPPFSTGDVLKADAKSFDVRVLPEYPVKGGEPVGAFMDYDRETGLPAKNCLDVYNAVTHTEMLAPQTLRVFTSRDTGVKAGMHLVLRHLVYGHNALFFSNVSDLTISNVTVYCTPGMGLVAGGCHDVLVDHYRVLPRPGSGRLMSATADAAHLGSCTGTMTIRDCVFDGMGDDGLNVKAGLYLTIQKQVDDHTVLGMHNLKMRALPRPGDTLEFIRIDTLSPYATGVVKNAVLEADNQTHRVEFETPLPSELKMGDVMGDASTAPRVRISNCIVRRNRARGFLIQTRDVVVENCDMQNITSGGIFVMTETVYFFESIGTRDVVLRNNRFTNCNYGGPRGEGVVMVSAYGPGFSFPKVPGVHRNILLEGNTIRTADNAGIFVAGADGITLRNNTIEDAARSPTRDECRAGIYVMGSRDVQIIGNSIDPAHQGAGFKTPLLTGPGCDTATLKVAGTRGF